MKFPVPKPQLDRHGGPGLLAGRLGEAIKPGAHTLTPAALTISHKLLRGAVGPGDTPSLHLSRLICKMGELITANLSVWPRTAPRDGLSPRLLHGPPAYAPFPTQSLGDELEQVLRLFC